MQLPIDDAWKHMYERATADCMHAMFSRLGIVSQETVEPSLPSGPGPGTEPPSLCRHYLQVTTVDIIYR